MARSGALSNTTEDQAVSEKEAGTLDEALKMAQDFHAEGGDGATDTPEPAAQSRDEGGRFAAMNETQPKPVQNDASPAAQNLEPSDTVTAPETGDDQSIGAPQSWPKSLHGEFANASPALKAQVLQREREFAKAIEQRTNDLKRYSDLSDVIKPYEAEFRRFNATPVQAVSYLLGKHADLQRDPVGGLMRLASEMGVDFRALAHQAQAPIDPVQSYLQQHLAPLQQTVAQMQEQQYAVHRAEAESKAEAFFAKNPLAREVEADMARLGAADPALLTDLDALFKMALIRRPDVAAQMRAQQQAEAAARTPAKAQAPKASSIRGAPAPGGSTAQTPKITNIQDALNAAIAEHS